MPSTVKPQALAEKALQTFATRLIASILGVAAGILVARVLGPSGKGAYSAVQTLVAVPVAVTGGIGSAITYFIAKERWSVRDVMPSLSLIFAACTACGLIAAAVFAALHGWNAPAIAFAVAIPASIVLSWQQGFYVGIDRLRSMNAQTLLQGIATLLALFIACVVFRGGTAAALAAWVVPLYVCAAIVAIDAARKGGSMHGDDVRSRLRRIVTFGSQSSLNGALGLLNYRVDSLILVALLGLASFGIYSIAVNLGETLFLLLRPVNVALGRDIGASSLERSAQLTADTVRAGFTAALFFAAAAATLGPFAIHAVYGGRFDAAVLPLRLLLPGIMVFGSAGTFASFFIFQLGRPMIVTWINVVMIAAQAAACVVLVPRYGMGGAAVASSVTYIIGASANTWLFCRASALKPHDLWLPRRSDARRIYNALMRALFRRRESAPRSRAPRIDPRTIAITGAAGKVATLLRPLLREPYALRLTDCRRISGMQTGESFRAADLRSIRSLRRAFRGARAVVHLGGISKEASFESIAEANVSGLRNVFEAARLEGIRRIVFASTGHVTGFYPRTAFLDESAPMRPDSLYAVSKGYGELLARFYADKFGMEVVCIRIGHVSAQPEYDVDRHIWISPRDLASLVRCALEFMPLRFEVVYGVSRNARSWWSLGRARHLGYDPQDTYDAGDELVSPPTRPAHVGDLVQGESFAAAGYDGPVSRVVER